MQSGFGTQFAVLITRGWRNILRNPMLFKVKIFQTLFVSLLIGSIYWRLDTKDL